jgi:hypothetical protein
VRKESVLQRAREKKIKKNLKKGIKIKKIRERV